jgi:hypothetical protein
MKNNLHVKTMFLSALFVFMLSLNLRSQCAATFTMGSSGPLTWTVNPTYAANTASLATWIWGDGSWSVGLYPSHTYTAAGIYTICVVTNNTAYTCTSTTCDSSYISKINMTSSAPITIQVINASTASINEHQVGASLSLFPNPSAGKVTIKGQKESGVVSIYNLLGVKVNEMKIERNINYTLDLSAYENGIYQVQFDNGMTISREKVILTK